MRKRKKKASSNRLMIFGTISIFIIVFFIYSLFSYVIQVKNLNNEQLKIKDNLSLLKEEEANLKNEIEKLKDPDYLARYARENYMYSKAGEYIIKVSDKEEETTYPNDTSNKKNYIGVVIVGSVLFLLLVFKKKII